MAGFLSTYAANKLLDHVYGGPDYTRPATLYCALFTVAPTAAGGGTEVSTSGTAYARVSFTNNSTNFPAATSATKRNATNITFGTPTADWGTVVGAAWFDSSTGGNMIEYGPFTTARTILNGDAAPSILANGGTFTAV